MDFSKRVCTVVNAEKGFALLTLQDDGDGSFILARVRANSPIGLSELFGVSSGLDLIGKEVNIDLLTKKLYAKDGDGKTKFARYNFQPV